MNRFFLFLLVIGFSLTVCAEIPPLPKKEGAAFVPGQLVAFIPASRNAQMAEISNILEIWGYTTTRKEIAFDNCTLRLYVPKEQGVEKDVMEAVNLFNQTMTTEGGAKLLPNYIFRVSDNNDPLFNRKDVYRDKDGNPHDVLLQWDMQNPGEFGGVVGADLNAVEAWNLVPPCQHPTIVAVIDTGVDVEHPGLHGRIYEKDGKVVGKDFTEWNRAGSFLDDHGHGSHCAGSIAAAWNDREGMTGSSGPVNVKIMPVKALAKDGSGDLFSITEAMEWAGKQGADVISMSFGATPMAPEQEPILKEVFDGVLASAALANTIPVAAAGNDGKEIHAFPAFCEKAIAIGASDHQDKKAVFSNFGEWVDVCSPGVNIVSIRAKHAGKFLDMYQDAGFKKAEFAVGNDSKQPYSERGYYIASGTSMATPNAAGIVAMLLCVNPKLHGKTEEVRKILMETSDKKGTFQISPQSGRINAANAVKAAKEAYDKSKEQEQNNN